MLYYVIEQLVIWNFVSNQYNIYLAFELVSDEDPKKITVQYCGTARRPSHCIRVPRRHFIGQRWPYWHLIDQTKPLTHAKGA